MERVVVVGNCQAEALELVLATNDAFTQRFELARFPAVHLIEAEQVPELQRAVESAAVVLLQRIEEGYRDGIGLGTETLARIARTDRVVRWPNVFWSGYVPDLIYLRDEARRPVVDGPFDYHDRVVLDAYAGGLDVAATCALLADPQRPSDAVRLADATTAELRQRSAGCDIQVADFVADRFRDELLFLTMNHPSNRMLAHVAQQFFDLLGVAGSVDLARFIGEILGPTFHPLHANHVRALGLRFDHCSFGRTPFRVRGVASDAPAAIAAFFDYYAANPRLVALNTAAREASPLAVRHP